MGIILERFSVANRRGKISEGTWKWKGKFSVEEDIGEKGKKIGDIFSVE